MASVALLPIGTEGSLRTHIRRQANVPQLETITEQYHQNDSESPNLVNPLEKKLEKQLVFKLHSSLNWYLQNHFFHEFTKKIFS